MAIADVTDPQAIKAAVQEFDRIGSDAFRARYGFRRTGRFLVEVDGRRFHPSELLSAAHARQFPDSGPLRPGDFSVAGAELRKLRELGFSVINLDGVITKSGRVFGEISGYPPGSPFSSYKELRAASVHKPNQKGISASESEGADSIVVNGGYDDDEDYGDVILYTGEGGQDGSGNQITDQKFKRGNLALAENILQELPVRVVRGSRGNPMYSPSEGYRYDGLYLVERHWHARGLAGFLIFRFRLVWIPGQVASLPNEDDGATPSGSQRATSVTQRIVRNLEVSRRVKAMHKFHCQICGEKIEIPGGLYAEGAHIKPLGKPHDGIDGLRNILCLCPNDHVRFDRGAVYLRDDFMLMEANTNDELGQLRIVRGHDIDPANIEYHRTHIAITEDLL